MNKDLVTFFEYMEREKGIKRQEIIKMIENALQLASKKSISNFKEISVSIDPKTGEIKITGLKTVVKEVVDPTSEIAYEKAKETHAHCKIGETIELETNPKDFGRIAAQVARQVILQKIRGAEKEIIHQEYRHRVNELISGTVKKKVRGLDLIVDLGKVEALLPADNYPKSERYKVGDRVLALLTAVQENENNLTQLILSRSSPDFVRQLFIQEVPELQEGVVTIDKIAREAGYRTKMVVRSHDERIDPVGTCVGVKGNRIKNIIRELGNEKIDVITYSEDSIALLQASIAPHEIKKINFNKEANLVSIIVDDEAFPSVVGRGGLNVNLISQLIGTRLDVQSTKQYNRFMERERLSLSSIEDPKLDEPIKLEKINKLVLDNLVESGYDTYRKILSASTEELTKIPGISLEMVQDIIEQIKQERIGNLG